MVAELSSAAAEPVGAGENLQWTPPTGSALAGGSVDVGMYGDGYGYDASATAVAYSPEFKYDGSDVLLQCSSGQPACSAGSSPSLHRRALAPVQPWRGLLHRRRMRRHPRPSMQHRSKRRRLVNGTTMVGPLPHSNSSTPTASNITGPLLNAGARGTQELTLTATDPSGPGVYTVTAQVDGKTPYSSTPNNNSGECVSTGSSGGALMFDYSQPCRQSESVDIPIETGTVTDGSHTLKVTVEDAAGNSNVVYDGTISTHNAPVNGSLPGIEASDPQATIGTQLSATNGAWEAPTGAGTISYTGQWLRCNTEGNACQPVSGASTANYTIASADAGEHPALPGDREEQRRVRQRGIPGEHDRAEHATEQCATRPRRTTPQRATPQPSTSHTGKPRAEQHPNRHADARHAERQQRKRGRLHQPRCELHSQQPLQQKQPHREGTAA